jgi:hypothetical protein
MAEEGSTLKAGPSPKRIALLVSAPLVLLVAWASVNGLSAGKKTTDDEVVIPDVVEEPVRPGPSESELNALESAIPDVDDVPVAAPAAARAVAKIRPAVAISHSKGPALEKISFATASYDFDHGAKFAEIHVRRSAAQADKTNFVWWTEPGSAAGGSEFVQQDRATAYFSRGDRLATLFVKLIPNPKRKKAQVFYVVITDPSAGAAIAGIPRAAVKLLPP